MNEQLSLDDVLAQFLAEAGEGAVAYHISDSEPRPGFLVPEVGAYGEPVDVIFIDKLHKYAFWWAFWDGLYDACKHDAKVVVLQPYHLSDRAHLDPDTRQIIPPQRYGYLNRDIRRELKLGVDAPDVHFVHHFDPWFIYDEQWAIGKSDAAKQHAKRHTWNAVEYLAVFLRAIKE